MGKGFSTDNDKWVSLSSLDEDTKDLIRQWVKEHKEVRPIWEKNPDKLEGYNTALNHILYALEPVELI